MDYNVDLPISKQDLQNSRHGQQTSRRSPCSSVQTLLQKPEVSSMFNTKSLKMNLRPIYGKLPQKRLKRMFERTNRLNSTFLLKPKEPRRKSHQNFTRRRNRPQPVDSNLNTTEANIIMDQLKHIKSPNVWNKLIHTFKSKPSLLMDLVPLKTSRTPKHSSNQVSKSRSSSHTRCFMATTRSVPKKLKIPTYRPSENSTPETLETLYQESENRALTDDWSKSLLNSKIKKGQTEFICQEGFNQSQLRSLATRIPKNPVQLAQIKAKTMKTLIVLLVECLGTKEDVNRFQKRFDTSRPSGVRNLISKCFQMLQIRSKTSQLLKLVNQRQNLIKSLKSQQSVKQRIIQIYRLNSLVRKKIIAWTKDQTIPFDEFIFKGQNYIQKISEDNLTLQDTLSKIQ